MRNKQIFILILSTFLFSQSSRAIHHALRVHIDPKNASIEVLDIITIPKAQFKKSMSFVLASSLTVSSENKAIKIKLEAENVSVKDIGMDIEDSSKLKKNRYKIYFSKSFATIGFTLKFKGKIEHKITTKGEEYSKGFSSSEGIISETGTYLAGSTYWLPWFNDKLITFDLITYLPKDYDVVSQGKRTRHEIQKNYRITHWESPELMEEVFLIAAKFHEYRLSSDGKQIMVFLRSADESLANKYLETTAQYMKMYQKLLGSYPFSKFALVENFWETGYGMPSFTLLGEKIIRFPFILHSSYPHELLHNWWGNSAYVNFDKGNWCEGLTAYMADHLIKEQRGQGDIYRRGVLQKYSDYVNRDNDFPLSQFISRNSPWTEAVGYGKSLMLWDMLRLEVGDRNFTGALQYFYQRNKYTRASYDDIQRSFEEITNKNLSIFFDQWVKRVGAPELKLSDASIEKNKSKYNLSFTIQQIQKGEAYNLYLPIAIFSPKNSTIRYIRMEKKETHYTLTMDSKPLVIKIDPQFNVFRRLHYSEIPPSLSKAFGAKKVVYILPSKEKNLSDYKKIAELWSKEQSKKSEIVLDSKINSITEDATFWIMGQKNKFAKYLDEGIKDYDAEIRSDKIRFGKQELRLIKNSSIISVRNPKNPNAVLVGLTIHDSKAVVGLARKLPHYGKYSYLAFEGTAPSNTVKGQWATFKSPLIVKFSNNKINSKLKKREALASLDPLFSVKRMKKTLEFLASDVLKGRAPGSPELNRAAEFIKSKFEKAGLKAGSDNHTFFQEWDEIVGAIGKKGKVKNVIGIIEGINPKYSGESVVIGAHYDHLGLGWPDARKGEEGKIHNGADDNASGVSVLLELAKHLGKTLKPQRTIVFIAFTSEESGLLGSRYYVKQSKRFPAKKIIGMLNMDAVGRLGKNKLMVLNTHSANDWKYIFMGAGYVTGVESIMPSQDLDSSDHLSFIEAKIPAVQFFSGIHSDYHKASDDADKIDYDGLVKVASYVREGLVYLADTDKKMPFIEKGKSARSVNAKKTGKRRASTGSMPDFSFSGEGVRLVAVSKNSPAAKAGLKKGDTIIQFGKYAIKNLREYSNALKQFKPRDKVKLVYLRDTKKCETEIILKAR